MLLNSSLAQAQLITLGDVIGNINILNTQVTTNTSAINTLQVDVSVLSGQTTTNTAAITQLNYDLGVVTAQLETNGTVVTALDGRVGAIEAALPPLNGRVAALEASVSGQAGTAAAIAANAAVGVANSAAIAANGLRNDGQDVAIAASAAVGAANTAALGVNTAAIAANDLRDDGQDVAIAANAAVGVTNAAAIAANSARDDGQDIAIAANSGALGVLDGRVTTHDAVLVQHATQIASATQTAVAAQTATATLRSDVEAGRVGLVQQDATGQIAIGAQTGGGTVSVAGTAGNRRMTGVADGIAPSDAATMGQVAQSQTQAVGLANAYTDRSMASFAAQMDDRTQGLISQNNSALRRDMNAAAASTAATASLPHSIVPGQGMGALSIGGRGDAVAFAVGMSKAFRVRNTPVVRAGAALDARTGTLTYNAAVGVHF